MSAEIATLDAATPASSTVRIWDKDFNLVGHVGEGWRVDQPGVLAVPLAHTLGKWLMEDARQHELVTLTADYDGLRYQGGLYEIKVMQEQFGGGKVRYVKATFLKIG